MTLADLITQFPGWHISLDLAGYHARRGPMRLDADTAGQLADLIWDYSGGHQ